MVHVQKLKYKMRQKIVPAENECETTSHQVHHFNINSSIKFDSSYLLVCHPCSCVTT